MLSFSLHTLLPCNYPAYNVVQRWTLIVQSKPHFSGRVTSKSNLYIYIDFLKFEILQEILT